MSTHRHPIVNLPRLGRDRGLGYASIGHTLGALDSWEVTAEWGRGAGYQPGHPGTYPVSAHPTGYPRAGAARVLGTSNAPAVGRPFASTRLPTMGHPLHHTPVIAPGASLRNPGMYGGLVEAASAVSALAQANVLAPAGLGLAVGLGGKFAGLTGTARNVAGAASLAALAWAAWKAYQNYSGETAAVAREAAERAGPGAATAAVGAPIAATAQRIVASGGGTDDEKVRTLRAYACYETARRTTGLWASIWAEPRDPLRDCGLTQVQADAIVAAFNKITKADRVRLQPGTFGPAGALKDLGR